MNDIEQLLRSKGVRPTPIRTGILSLLKQSNRAYSNADLEQAFDHALDRISLYRSLLTLTETGLVHKHIDAKGTCSYFFALLETAPRASDINTITATDTFAATDYPHFKCTQCESVVPLPKLPEAYLALVRQYQLNSLRLQADGTCDDCFHRSELPIQSGATEAGDGKDKSAPM